MDALKVFRLLIVGGVGHCLVSMHLPDFKIKWFASRSKPPRTVELIITKFPKDFLFTQEVALGSVGGLLLEANHLLFDSTLQAESLLN